MQPKLIRLADYRPDLKRGRLFTKAKLRLTIPDETIEFGEFWPEQAASHAPVPAKENP